MATTIKVKSVTIKKEGSNAQGVPYKIIEVVDELTGTKYDSFADLKEGQEYTGEVKPNANPMYNGSFTPAKAFTGGKSFTPKDETWNKRATALSLAITMLGQGSIEIKDLNTTRDKFFNYINTGV